MKTSDKHTDFTRQVSTVTNRLHRYALRLTKDPEDANDLVQDTLLKAYRYWHKFQPDSNLKAWLLTIMRNTFMTQCVRVRRERLVIVLSHFYELENSVFSSLQNGAISQAVQDEIRTAIDLLLGVYREPLLLHMEGFKYHEIAQQLSIPIGTVKNRIFVARKELQRQLQR